MIEKTYTPHPIDTSCVRIPEELDTLTEKMSKNVHEVWAAERIRQGWIWGERRSDELKLHPCLVPYDELPEEEKVYDRNTSIATLKFILAQGYKIIKA